MEIEFPLNGRCDTDMAFIKSHGSYRKLRRIQRQNKTNWNLGGGGGGRK